MTRPADPFFVALYLNHLLITKGKAGSIINAYYGIRWGHHIAGLNSPTENPLVKLAFEGCQRLCPHNSQRKEPIDPETIKKLVDSIAPENPNLLQLRTIVVCVVGFAGFFRIDELLNTQLKEVEIKNDFMKITVPKSKTDQHRDGHEVIIARLSSNYCPVKLVEKFLMQAGLEVGNKSFNDCYLIPRLTKTKKGHKAIKDKGITYTTIRDLFKGILRDVVEDVDKYGLHSLRSGGASAAAANDVSDRMISKQGRWKSERGRNGYIKDTLKNKMKISKSLGL